jgi:hypothetical protein
VIVYRYADRMSANEEQVLGQPLAERVVIEVSASQDDFSALEQALTELDDTPGVTLHESDPSSPVLRSSGWQTVVVSVASAGGLKMVRDVLVAHISSRRVKISVTRSGTKKSVIFEGHVRNPREVEQIVREITAEQPSD